MDPAIIIALISLVGSIILNSFQFVKDKKKADVDAVTQLIQKALEMNKQELEVVREISNDLRSELAEAKEENIRLKGEIEILKAELLKKDAELVKFRISNELLTKRVEALELKQGEK